MKSFYLFLFLLLLSFPSSAQIFSPITTGDIVNDGGSSFGHSICDFNNDGWEDIFVSNLDLNQENFFYKNNGDGTFSKMPNLNIVTGNASASSTWGDYNGDGFMDVFVANGGTEGQKQNFLFTNNGDETFSQVLTGPIVNQTSAFTCCSWLDVDNDADLDLFVGSSSGANQVFINVGNGEFSADALNDTGGSWGVSWSDYDKDGDLDGFGTNWGKTNSFYKNEGGTLNKISFAPLTSGINNSLSPSWGDYDNDTWMDLFVGNSAAPDRLFKNNGDGTFTEINNSPITNSGANSEGSCWIDYDNDGDVHLLVASGGNQSTGEIRMYENNGDGTFTEQEDGQLTNLSGRYEGLTCFDYDQDGDLDIFISNYFNNDNLLYQNNGNDNHWISISLVGTDSNVSGIGSKVYVYAVIDGQEVWQFREIIAHTGHVTQGSLKAHFGLGDATAIDSIKVVWPTQEEQVLTDVVVDQALVMVEEEQPTNVNMPLKLKRVYDLNVTPNPVTIATTLSFELKDKAQVQLEILDIKGRLIQLLHNDYLVAGRHQFEWNQHANIQKLQTGYYIVSLTVDDFRVSKRVLIQD